MCGIAGSLGQIPVMQKRLLAILNEERGNDSVGMMSDFRVCRIPDSISKAVLHDRIPEWAWTGNFWAVHTRASSPNMGGISKETTHPFTYGDWTAAHNGFIRNWREIIDDEKKKHPCADKFRVDSNVIPLLLHEYGFEGLKKLSGSAAVWFFNKKEKDIIYLWINDQMCSLYQDENVVVWSSDEDHLKLAGFSKKNTIRLKDDGQLIKIFIDQNGETDATQVGTFEGKKITYTTPSIPYRYHAYDDDNMTFPYIYNEAYPQNAPVFKSIRLKDVPDSNIYKCISYIKDMDYHFVYWCDNCKDVVIEADLLKDRYIALTATRCPHCKGENKKINEKNEITSLLTEEMKRRIEIKKQGKDNNNTVIIDGVSLNLNDPNDKLLAIINHIENKKDTIILWCTDCHSALIPQDYKDGKYTAAIGSYYTCPYCKGIPNEISLENTKACEKIIEITKFVDKSLEKDIECCETCGGVGMSYEDETIGNICAQCGGTGINNNCKDLF